MTDREMLELAAKAAGLDVEFFPLSGANIVSGPHTGLWRPRDDDGDALRLLCKTSMRIIENRSGAYRAVQFTVNPGEDEEEDREIEIDWPHTPAATRIAITRAAAEIGKAMQETAS